jgi:hypothetical protein
LTEKDLDPADRPGEILFGAIMVLTVTYVLNLEKSEKTLVTGVILNFQRFVGQTLFMMAFNNVSSSLH